MSLLIDAAYSFSRLINYQYLFVLGKRGELVNLYLNFHDENFYHLAGLHKLKDIYASPRMRKGSCLEFLLADAQETNFERSYFYPDILPRLEILNRLEAFLDNELLAFRFIQGLAYSKIKADFLLEGKIPVEGRLFVKSLGNSDQYISTSLTPLADKRLNLLPKYKILHKQKRLTTEPHE